MNDSSNREPDEIRQACVRKLAAVEVSDHFRTILGCLSGADRTAILLLRTCKALV